VCIYCLWNETAEQAGYKQMTSQEILVYKPFPLEDAILILKPINSIFNIAYASEGKHCELQEILGKNTH